MRTVVYFPAVSLYKGLCKTKNRLSAIFWSKQNFSIIPFGQNKVSKANFLFQVFYVVIFIKKQRFMYLSALYFVNKIRILKNLRINNKRPFLISLNYFCFSQAFCLKSSQFYF